MLIAEIDYYINQDGNFVFTEKYHRQRGFCCKNQCKHCPWNFKKAENKKDIDEPK
jgi:hypothetical protein